MRKITLDRGRKAAVAELERKPVDDLVFHQRAEVYFLRLLVERAWQHLESFGSIEFCRGKGPDIVLKHKTGGVGDIAVEMKSSRRKTDYLNRNGSKVELFGNALKAKDVDLRTGLLFSNVMVLAAEVREGKKDNPFDFWVFSRADLAHLYPKAALFMPSHVPSLLADKTVGKSPFSDEFTAFAKGVYQIVLPPHVDGLWAKTYPEEFSEAWCPLIRAEFGELSRLTTRHQDRLLNNWNKVFKSHEDPPPNPNFKRRVCEYWNPAPTQQDCVECRRSVGLWLN